MCKLFGVIFKNHPPPFHCENYRFLLILFETVVHESNQISMCVMLSEAFLTTIPLNARRSEVCSLSASILVSALFFHGLHHIL